MALTDKQQRFVEGRMTKSVQILRMIARHIGMLPLTPSVVEANRAKITDDMLVWALLALVSDVPIYKRAVAMLLLDLVSSDWRSVAGPEILGFAVGRESTEARRWRNTVLINDNHQCTRCGSTDRVEAHHIIRWADDPSQRLNPSNGMALCKPCHDEEHRLYG